MLPVLRNGAVPTVFTPINRLDSIFDRVFSEAAPTAPAWGGVPMSMWEDEDHIYVEAELPGLADGDVDVTIHRGMLFIRGERKAPEGRRRIYDGRSYGRFERSIDLPEAVDATNIEATMKDGVLSIRLPKSPESKPRKIEVRRS
jgi:HSP20 family protein